MELLKYSLPYLTVLGSIGAFCFTVFQYLHSQNQIAKDKRFEQFRMIFEWVAGRTANGINLVDTQQAMAVYQLSEFPEYKNISLPIIEYYLVRVTDSSLLRTALLFSKAKLENN